MRKPTLRLALAAVAASYLLIAAPGARASAPSVDHVSVVYHGDALMRHVRVATLFWGKQWDGAALRDYFNSFFRDLFADGRYMANLEQYSAGEFRIGNGALVATDTDTVAPPKRVTDAQIQSEIRARIAAGRLPKPDADMLYVVCTPPNVVIVDSGGEDSENDFLGYHDFSPDGQFAYAAIPYTEYDGDPRPMTITMSHELAEAVTDPEPELQRTFRGGWYDETYGEIGDIPAAMLAANQITLNEYIDVLRGPDGTPYLVQTEWSNQDQGLVAFADRAAP